MAFDIEAASKSGYSKKEMIDYLAQQGNFDVSGAIKAGYTEDDILAHLANEPWKTQPAKQEQEPPIPEDIEALGAGGILPPPKGYTLPGDISLGAVGMLAGGVAGSAAGKGLAAVAPRVLPYVRGIAEGAVAGGVSAGVEGEDIKTGAGLGAGISAALPAVAGIGKLGYNVVAPLISKSAAKAGAAKQVIEAAGDDALNFARKLASGQPAEQSQIETAAQILSESNNPRISALQTYWQNKFGSVDAYRNKLAQNDLEVARIKLLGAETQPQRQAAIDEANRITKAFQIASKKGTDYRDEAAKLVAETRKVVSLQQSAAEQAIMPRLVGVAERKATETAEQSLKAGASARLAENIVGNMEQRGLVPLSAESLIAAINKVKNSPENIVNDSLRLLSNRVEKAVTRAAQANNGVLDAASLDALRRTAINDFIASASKGNPAQAKQLASHEVTTSFKKFIDDSIESAGGKGYVDYMKNYSTVRQQIEAPLLRMEKSDEMAKAGMEEITRIMNSHNVHGLSILERSVTIFQSLLRAMKGVAGRKVGEEGAKLMTNRPEELGRLMLQRLEPQQGMLSTIYQPGVIAPVLMKREDEQ